MAKRRKDLLLSVLSVAGDAEGAAWHDSLLTTLAGVEVDAARWTPAPGRPSVWDLVRHVVTWKKVVMEAFDHGYVDPKGAVESDWGPLPDDDEAWPADVKELARITRLMAQRVSASDDQLLENEVDGLSGTLADQLAQMATHDAYHAGQIRTLLRLRETLNEGPSA